MDDARRVGPGEGVRDLRRGQEKALHGQWAARHELSHRGALHELHDDVREIAGLSDLVDGHDVRMIQGGRGASLLLESR